MIMISRRLYIGLILVAAVAVACPVMADYAQAESTGYTARPGAGAGVSTHFNAFTLPAESLIVTMTAGDIGIGERKHFVKNVDSDIKTLNVDLKWQNPGVGLKLLVYSPGGIQFGPWDDGADGSLDREINMDIYNPGGIEKGQWQYYVIYDRGVERTGFSI